MHPRRSFHRLARSQIHLSNIFPRNRQGLLITCPLRCCIFFIRSKSTTLPAIRLRSRPSYSCRSGSSTAWGNFRHFVQGLFLPVTITLCGETVFVTYALRLALVLRPMGTSFDTETERATLTKDRPKVTPDRISPYPKVESSRYRRIGFTRRHRRRRDLVDLLHCACTFTKTSEETASSSPYDIVSSCPAVVTVTAFACNFFR